MLGVLLREAWGQALQSAGRARGLSLGTGQGVPTPSLGPSALSEAPEGRTPGRV